MTLEVHEQMRAALAAGASALQCSLDLERSRTQVSLSEGGWSWEGSLYPWPAIIKDRTIYYWTGGGFEPVSRYSSSLLKLVPTQWGPPTFEIDGIKMLPTAKISPYEDARQKVGWIQPRGKVILDTCGGLGYYAAWCVQEGAAEVLSYEKNPGVLWLRGLNPWSPRPGGVLQVTEGDITAHIGRIAASSVGAVLHDPPRFGIAGELYSQVFYDELARVLARKGRLFHYTGSPNKLTSGRDVPSEVANRLKRAGFNTELRGDGVLATKR